MWDTPWKTHCCAISHYVINRRIFIALCARASYVLFRKRSVQIITTNLQINRFHMMRGEILEPIHDLLFYTELNHETTNNYYCLSYSNRLSAIRTSLITDLENELFELAHINFHFDPHSLSPQTKTKVKRKTICINLPERSSHTVNFTWEYQECGHSTVSKYKWSRQTNKALFPGLEGTNTSNVLNRKILWNVAGFWIQLFVETGMKRESYIYFEDN